MAFDEKLFQDNFSFGVRASIANTIRIATAAFTSFWKDNASFLNGADEFLTMLSNGNFKILPP